MRLVSEVLKGTKYIEDIASELPLILAAFVQEIRIPALPAAQDGQRYKGNRTELKTAMDSLSAILTDVKEKNSMIDAGETHGAEWAKREDDFGECQTILENMQTELDRLDYLL